MRGRGLGWRGGAAVLALVAGGVAVSGPEAAPVPRAPAAVPDDAPLRQAMLDGHAAARAAVGLPPLAWDDRLADAAGRHARAMADSGRFEHEAQSGHFSTRQGENLWAGTGGAYAYAEMVDGWVAERRDFVPGATPAFSRTGRWQDVGHYAQIVWRETSRVGCALARGAAEEYLVCRYSPAGNIVGERPY